MRTKSTKRTAGAVSLVAVLLQPLCAMAADSEVMVSAPATTSSKAAMPKIEDAVDPKNDTQPVRVNSVNFYGNTRIPTPQLLPGIGIKPGDLMAKEKMGAAMDYIVAQYKASGLDVEVRPRVSHPRQNFVDVNFLINEQGKGGHD